MHNLSRIERTVTDFKMLLKIISIGYRKAKELGMSTGELFQFIRNQITLSQALKYAKYVEFEQKIFMDSFAPHWPSTASDSVQESFIQWPQQERHFIDYAVFAITNRCMFRCKHCYAIGMLRNRDILTLEELLCTAKHLQDVGIGILSLEGGEPLLRFDDLVEVMQSLRPGTAIWMATTGYGLTEKMAYRLKEAGLTGVTISLDHYEPETHNAFRGNPKAFSEAAGAVKLFRNVGIFPVMAIVPTKDMLNDEGLYRYLELAKELGAGMIQVLDPMPSGRYLNEDESFFSKKQLDQLIAFQIEVNTSKKFHDYPAVSSRAYLEDDSRDGCGMGGFSNIYIDASGNVQPCVYLNVSFGNITRDGFPVAYKRMRDLFPHPMDGPCPVFYLHKKVAEIHSTGVLLPLESEHAQGICKDMHLRGLPGLFSKIMDSTERV